MQSFSADGHFLSAWGEAGTNKGQFNQPIDLVVDEQGHVSVVDCCNYRVQVFDEDGHYLAQFGKPGFDEGDLSGPVSIARDASGQLYVSDANRGVVLAYRLDLPAVATPAP